MAVGWIGRRTGGWGLAIFRDKEPTEEAEEWAGEVEVQ